MITGARTIRITRTISIIRAIRAIGITKINRVVGTVATNRTISLTEISTKIKIDNIIRVTDISKTRTGRFYFMFLYYSKLIDRDG